MSDTQPLLPIPQNVTTPKHQNKKYRYCIEQMLYDRILAKNANISKKIFIPLIHQDFYDAYDLTKKIDTIHTTKNAHTTT